MRTPSWRSSRIRAPERAAQVLQEQRAIDPSAEIFRAPALNRLAYRVLRTRTPAESIVLFRRIVEWFPASSNAYDSLSEGLEAAGQCQQAIEVAERGLEVLAKQDLTPDQRRDMAALLEGRVKRLK